MDTYDVEFSVTLKSTIRIASQNEAEANAIVEQLVDSYDFTEMLKGEMAMDPYCGWDELHAELGSRREDVAPTISPEALEQDYGVTVGSSVLHR